MYIGKLGDGSSPDDGIYVLLKEVIDNCIDEHTMGYGKHVDVNHRMAKPLPYGIMDVVFHWVKWWMW
jgi:DNA gyrase/topoisomerase IV subunit B